MKRLAATLLLVGALTLGHFSTQGWADEQDPAVVMLKLSALLNKGDTRPLFGLPAERYWRATDPIKIALLTDSGEKLQPTLVAVEETFSKVTKHEISLAAVGDSPASLAEVRQAAEGADLVLAIGPRDRMAAFAARLGVAPEQLEQFKLGASPYVFRFSADPGRQGTVLIAETEPLRAIDEAFVLGVVWSLGGATLGPELEGLVDAEAETPKLTDLGRSVFRLMYAEKMESGITLNEALVRAQAALEE